MSAPGTGRLQENGGTAGKRGAEARTAAPDTHVCFRRGYKNAKKPTGQARR